MSEDLATRSMVSSACLIPQRFSYEGLEFPAGLPKLVGTHLDYRRRGLIGAQFEVLHRWSEERGHLMQTIGGIPSYYRRFGYEMALYMGEGRRLYVHDVPETPSDASEGEKAPRSYTLRPASTRDAAYYIRVPDLPGFVRHIAPTLEQRLASSVAAGHSGEFKLIFYGCGLRLELLRGRLHQVEHWSPTVEEEGDAAFPDLAFLQLLFGLLNTLFPLRPSSLWPVF